MIPPALVCALALIDERYHLRGELDYIAKSSGGCGGREDGCDEIVPCACCVARYAIAGWSLHEETRRTHRAEASK